MISDKPPFWQSPFGMILILILIIFMAANGYHGGGGGPAETYP